MLVLPRNGPTHPIDLLCFSSLLSKISIVWLRLRSLLKEHVVLINFNLFRLLRKYSIDVFLPDEASPNKQTECPFSTRFLSRYSFRTFYTDVSTDLVSSILRCLLSVHNDQSWPSNTASNRPMSSDGVACFCTCLKCSWIVRLHKCLNSFENAFRLCLSRHEPRLHTTAKINLPNI